MRWGYLIPRLLVMLMFWGFLAFGFDPSLRYIGKTAVSGVTGRAVNLDRVTTQLWPPRIEAAGFEVSEAGALDRAEWRAESMHIDIDEQALRHRRWVANEVVVNGVTWSLPSEFESSVDQGESSDTGWSDALKQRSQDALKNQLEAIQERVAGQINGDRFETVQLAKTKRTEYQEIVTDLRARVDRLYAQADQYQQIAKNPSARRELLLHPERVEQLAKEAKHIETEIRLVRDEIRSLKQRLPIDYQELDAAKDRDLAAAKVDWENFTSGPDQLVDLILGGPVADTLGHVAVWWPRWQRFRESGDWKQQHQAERRGRTIVFLPHQAGPLAGIKRMRMTGIANRGLRRVPFQCELGDLTYPPVPDAPASFRWASDGDVQLQAAGLVRLHNDKPEMTIQFRLHEKSAIQSRQQVGPKTTIAFASKPTIAGGTITLGRAVHGDCQFEFPAATAVVRTGDQRYDSLLSALDIDAESLKPTLTFEAGTEQSKFNIKCQGLDVVKGRWTQQLTSLGRQQAAALQAHAENYLTAEIDAVVDTSSQFDHVLAGLPDFDATQFAMGNLLPKGLVPESIQRTAGERVTEQAQGLFNKILR